MKKSYMRTIMEDLAPYLVQVEQTDKESRYSITYTFNISKLMGNERFYIFIILNNLTKQQRNWKRIESHVFKWETDSVQLHNWFIGEKVKKEPINDIPDHMVDADFYTSRFKQEYKCNFKQMEKQVNKDKFSAQNKTFIKVNGKDYTLTSPFDADASLGVILELTERLAILNGQILQLATINADGDQTDAIQFDKVVAVATDEISDIKEMIDFINDNIEEVE